MHMHNRPLAWLAVGLLSTSLLLSACQSTTTPVGDTDAPTDQTTAVADTAPSEITYSVTVKLYDGTAPANMIVKLLQNGEQIAMAPTNAAGSASFTLAAGSYTVDLQSPDGKTYYFPETTLTAEAPTATLDICTEATAPFKMNAPSKTNTDGYIPMDTYEVAEGTTHLTLNAADHTYIVFNPTRAGYYEFTCSEGVDFAYHGMPILIYDEPRVPPTDGVITMPAEEGSIGDNSISRLVFRLNASADSGATEALFTVKYTGELVKTPEELAQWIVFAADPNALVKYEGSTEGRLTDVDVTDPTVQVVKGDDGYYHFGTADGPVVFLRIASENKYTQSFKEMCDTDRIRAFFYDENGTFLRKEGYSELILAYAEYANAEGLVPLNDQLIYVLQNAGNYMGWWDFVNNRDIFGDVVVDEKVAWMFACAYYA